MPDTVIIGAGICGLQLAALLAHDGQKVLVLERTGRLGGRAALWEKDGFTVDFGMHLIRFGDKSATARIFSRIGERLDFVGLGPSRVCGADGRVVDFPASALEFASTRMMTASERAKTVRLLLWALLGGNKAAGPLLETSVGDWMVARGLPPGARSYFRLACASMQVCPDVSAASMGEFLKNIRRVLATRRSAMYPAQGWRHIYDTLASVVGSTGEIRTGATVRSIIVERGKARGVELETGETIAAGRVVAAVPCQKLFEMLETEGVPAPFVSLCRGLRPTAGLSVDFGLGRKVSDSTGLWYLWEPLSFGLFTSNLCPGVAPPGKQILTWFVPADVEHVRDQDAAKRLEKDLEAAVFRLYPGLESSVEWKRSLRLSMVDGAEINVRQHAARRPGYRVPGVADLFLVGDTTCAQGAGGDVGHESVLGCYKEMTGKSL